MSIDDTTTSSATTSAADPAPRRTPTARRWALIGIGGAVIAAVIIRCLLWTPLWLDETLTVNIAKLPLADIPGALRQDGAPPLTYVLLHSWIGIFGTSTIAVRALSAVIGIALLPFAYFAGRRVGRARGAHGAQLTAIAALLLVASSPYAARYATETRMYALQMLLVVIGYLVLTNLLERPGLGWTAALAAVATALLYNHYWSLYLLAVVGVGLCVAAVRATGTVRTGARYGVGALVVAGVAFLPWVPTFLFQLGHTGTPWAVPPSPTAGLAWTLVDFTGGDSWAAWPLVLMLIVMFALAIFGIPESMRTVLLDLRTVRGVRLLALAGLGTALVGLTLAWALGSAVQVRYAALVFPLLVLATAYGLTALRDVRIAAGLLAAVTVLGLVVSVPEVIGPRTQAPQVVSVIKREAKPGDVVVFCPDQLGPDTTRLLPAGLTLRAFPDSTDPSRINWIDYRERMSSTSGATYADAIFDQAAGRTVWVVWNDGYRIVGEKCTRMLNRMSARRVRSDRVTPRRRQGESMGLAQFNP